MSTGICINHNLPYFMRRAQSSKMKQFDKSSFFGLKTTTKFKKKSVVKGTLQICWLSMFESNPYPRFILNCMSAYVMRCNYLSFYLRWEREKYKRLHNAINSFSISCLVSAFQPLSRRKKVNVMVFYIILWQERYLKAVDRTNDFKPFSNFLWPIQR